MSSRSGLARLLSLAALGGLLSIPVGLAQGQVTSATDGLETLTLAERVEGLSTVWAETKYNYPMWHRLPELDWDAEYRKRVPLALAKQSDWDYYRLLRGYLALVKDPHCLISMPDRFWSEYRRPSLRLWPVEGRFVVRGYHEAIGQATGISLGDEVLSVDGQSVESRARQIASYTSAATDASLAMGVSDDLLLGPRTEPLQLGLCRGDGTVYTCSLMRARPGGEWVWYEPLSERWSATGRSLGGGLGYIRLPSFSQNDYVVEEFDQLVVRLAVLQGLVLDLRMNGGGNWDDSDQIIGRLIDRPLPSLRNRQLLYSPLLRALGRGDHGNGVVWKDQQGSHNPQGAVRVSAPLAILTSRRTLCAAEWLVGALQTGRRAIVVGEASGGSAGSGLVFDLPGGGSAKISVKYEQLPDGTEFIGRGIQPDIPVELTQQDIALGRDPVLERAVAWLNSQSRR